jgi:biotin carboxylase
MPDRVDGRLLVVIGGFSDDLLLAARSLGLRTAFFQTAAHLSAEQRAAADAVHVFDSLDDHGAIVRTALALHRRTPLAHVVSNTEFGLEPAALVAAELALPRAASPELVRLFRDKAAMRAALSGTPGAVRAYTVRSSLEAAVAVRRLGSAAVVKPSDGWGSLVVELVRTPEDAVRAYDHIVAIGGRGALVEEYLAGQEVSVETFSFDGRHVVVAVTEKFKLSNFVETGHLVPARLERRDVEAVSGAVVDFLTLLGLTDGPAHTEVILTPSGPRVVESHNRIAGDAIPTAVRAATGVDLVRWTVAWPMFAMEPPETPPTASAAACVRFLTPSPGRVTVLPDVAALRQLDGVVEMSLAIGLGSLVRPVRHSFDRAGHVVVTAPDPEAALLLADQVAAKAHLTTDDAVTVDLAAVTAAERRYLRGR